MKINKIIQTTIKLLSEKNDSRDIFKTLLYTIPK